MSNLLHGNQQENGRQLDAMDTSIGRLCDGLSDVDTEKLSIYTITLVNKILRLFELIGDTSTIDQQQETLLEIDGFIDYVIESLEYINRVRIHTYSPNPNHNKIQASQEHRSRCVHLYMMILQMIISSSKSQQMFFRTSDKYSERIEILLDKLVRKYRNKMEPIIIDGVSLHLQQYEPSYNYTLERTINVMDIFHRYATIGQVRSNYTHRKSRRFGNLPIIKTTSDPQSMMGERIDQIDDAKFEDADIKIPLMMLHFGDIMSGISLINDNEIQQTAIHVGLTAIQMSLLDEHQLQLSKYKPIVTIKVGEDYPIPSIGDPMLEKIFLYYPLLSSVKFDNAKVDHSLFEDFDDSLIRRSAKLFKQCLDNPDGLGYDRRGTHQIISRLVYASVHDYRPLKTAHHGEFEDVRSDARSATKKVVRTKKQIDTAVDKKVVSPVAKNLEDLILGLTSNDVQNEKEKRDIRENISKGRYTAKFLIKKYLNHLATKAVIMVIAGPGIGLLINVIITYLDIRRTKAVSDKERRRMSADFDDALEILDMKINSTDDSKKKIALVKMRQKLSRSQSKIKFNDDSVSKKGD